MAPTPDPDNAVDVINFLLSDDGEASGSVTHALARLTVSVREPTRGDGNWLLTHVTVSAHSGESMAASILEDLPLARAVAAVAAQARSQRRTPFAEMHSVPPAWHGDRRGRAPRTELDHALLAQSYALSRFSTRKGRQQLPHEWSERYGGKVKTWQDRVSKLRAEGYLGRATDPDQLSDKSLELLYGADVHDSVAQDAVVEQDIAIGESPINPEAAAQALRNGVDPSARRDAARQRVRGAHPGYQFEP